MTLADSNLIIYAANPGYDWLAQWFAEEEPSVSRTSYVEALGFHKLAPDERQNLEEFFLTAEFLEISEKIAEEAVRLRQQRRMDLGDALIGATALVHGMRLATRNTSDFSWIPNLSVFDPFEQRNKDSREGA